jgi:nucleoside-diphosphate-sugar epimerase
MDFSLLKNKTTLLTGAAGFIGSHLAEKILSEGGRVIGVDNFVTGQRKHIEELQHKFPQTFYFVEADASQNPESYLQPLFEEHEVIGGIDFTLHFASPASPPKYQKYPIETYLINSMGTHQLLSYLLSNFPDSRFLFASTSEIYGNPLEHPQKESYWGNVNPNGIRACYDESKRLGESICGVFQRDMGMDVRMVRIFNTYGPRIDLEDGRVIPSFITSSLKGIPFQVYGDGSQTRSFCYIDDLVAGILGLLVHPDGNGKTINLGNPNEFTIVQAVKIFEKVLDHHVEVEYKSLPQDDPARRQPDITRATELLGWRPTVEFEEGIKKTLEYFRNAAS